VARVQVDRSLWRGIKVVRGDLIIGEYCVKEVFYGTLEKGKTQMRQDIG